MILSDVDIQEMLHSGEIVIDPFDRRLLKRNSYLLRLGNLFRIIDSREIIDTADPSHFDGSKYPVVQMNSIVLEPGKFVLGTSLESIAIPNDVVGLLSGISNLARLGVQIHSTSYLINAGFGRGKPSRITFELSTVGSMRVKLYYNLPVCHLFFANMNNSTRYMEPSSRTGQSGPELSELYNQFGHFIAEGLSSLSDKKS